ncbi:MAG: hypothetical protein ABL982_14435 [Vicinamibacterales bacterium]
MSPILVRPVREQLEHDRIIRLLHSKSRRKYDAGMNPGAEQNVPVVLGLNALYPDLVLHSQERGRRLEVIVEVETGESVNHLEALAQWTHFSKVKAAFHLYVPSGMVDVARRLCEDNHIVAHEVWSYHSIGDDVRFTLIQRAKELPVYGPPTRRADEPAVKAVAKAPVTKPPVKSVARPTAPVPVKPVKAVKAVKAVNAVKAAKKKVAAAAPAKRPVVKKKAAPVAKRPVVKAKRPVAPVKKKAATPRRTVAAPAKKKAVRPTKRK